MLIIIELSIFLLTNIYNISIVKNIHTYAIILLLLISGQ